MSIVIHVNDDLASRLQTEARQRKLPVEQLAITILDHAVPPSRTDQEWGDRNRRRLDLIRKSTRQELTDPEQRELDELQNWLDERFDSFDAGLLAQLDGMKRALSGSLAEQSHE
jgi:hypothetical protein